VHSNETFTFHKSEEFSGQLFSKNHVVCYEKCCCKFLNGAGKAEVRETLS
jgi:hypothetical protein